MLQLIDKARTMTTTSILEDWVRGFLMDHNAISTELTYLVFVAALKTEVSPPIS
jgi:hypothetical protein